MTDQELLQQCKDEVAQTYEYFDEDRKCQTWDEFVESHALRIVKAASDRAAVLAIQRAREEWIHIEFENPEEFQGPGESVLLYSNKAKYYVVGYWDTEDKIWRPNDGAFLYCQPSHYKKIIEPKKAP